MQKLKIIVSGRVQGVGFRYFVMGCAKKLGILGRVWNNDDGTVGIWAQTDDDEKMNQFINQVRKGPIKNPFAKVTYIDAVLANFPDFKDFNVTYDMH